ncbi:MAG: hypothetical protein E4H46_02365, partial [Desulfobacterales bacterium]
MSTECNYGSCPDINNVNVPGLFGSNVFSEKIMRERLPKETYKALKETIEIGASLKPETAAVVA